MTAGNSTKVYVVGGSAAAPSSVQGNVAAGVADSGNPVKVGGVYNATKPTIADLQRGDLQIGTRGSLSVQIYAHDSTTGLAVSTGADSSSNAYNALRCQDYLYGFNGTTWDRLRVSTAQTLQVEMGYSYSRKTADGQVKATAGFVHAVNIAPLTATPTAGLLSIYDSAAESGTVVYSEWIFATTPGHTIILDVACATGIFVGFDGTLANVTCTVSYR